MSKHIDDQGRFQSDKYLNLPPDRIRLNFADPLVWPALAALAANYRSVDPAFADDIEQRLRTVRDEVGP